MRRLTVGTRDGDTRDLVLRTFVDPSFVENAEELLHREYGVLALLAGTDGKLPSRSRSIRPPRSASIRRS